MHSYRIDYTTGQCLIVTDTSARSVFCPRCGRNVLVTGARRIYRHFAEVGQRTGPLCSASNARFEDVLKEIISG